MDISVSKLRVRSVLSENCTDNCGQVLKHMMSRALHLFTNRFLCKVLQLLKAELSQIRTDSML
jgi:hypothetical protein